MRYLLSSFSKYSSFLFCRESDNLAMAVHSQNSDINPLADIDLPSPPLQSEDSAEVAQEPFDETHIKVAPLRFKD